jgi:hypothetical protein
MRQLTSRRRSRRPHRAPIKAHRAFDPRRVGTLECDAWVAYYRRSWLAFLRSAVALTRHTFGLPWPATLRGAWLVLRANQLWAPLPDNDPEGARREMARLPARFRCHRFTQHLDHKHGNVVARVLPGGGPVLEDCASSSGSNRNHCAPAR